MNAELYELVKIPDEHIADRRHSVAQCCVCHRSGNIVRYRMSVVHHVEGEDFLDTSYYCEDHKP